jgi:hypothetical protein
VLSYAGGRLLHLFSLFNRAAKEFRHRPRASWLRRASQDGANFMIDTNAVFGFETGRRSFAQWAEKKPRRLGLSAVLGHALMRVRPRLAINAALVICAVSGAGMLFVAAYALGVRVT